MARVNEILRGWEVSTFSVVGSIVFGATPAAAEGPQNIDPLTQCPVGESPSFGLDFVQLNAALGEQMGNPLECAHPSVEQNNNDLLQLTDTGLAYLHQPANIPTFTLKDGRHYAIQGTEILVWDSPDIAPPATAALFKPELETAIKPEGPLTTMDLVKIADSVDSVTYTDQGKNYTIQSRMTSSATAKANINPETLAILQTTVAAAGREHDFDSLILVAVDSQDELPADAGEIYGSRGVISPTETVFSGFFKAIQIGHQVMLLWAPAPELVTASPAALNAVSRDVVLHFLSAAVTGGNIDAAKNPLGGTYTATELINNHALTISHS